MGFVDSDTAKINVDHTGAYPTASIDVTGIDYSNVTKLTTTEIIDYKNSNNGDGYPITINKTKPLINIFNNDINGTASDIEIVLSDDLTYEQPMEINIMANDALYTSDLKISMMYDGGSGAVKTTLLDDIKMPIDLDTYDPNTYNRAHYMSSEVYQMVDLLQETGATIDGVTATTTLFYSSPNLMKKGEWVFVDNLVMQANDGTITNKSGFYKIISADESVNSMYVEIQVDLDLYDNDPSSDSYNPTGSKVLSIPTIRLYKGVKYTIIRVDNSDTSTISDRYMIERKFI
jgi:hypothetical protein